MAAHSEKWAYSSDSAYDGCLELQWQSFFDRRSKWIATLPGLNDVWSPMTRLDFRVDWGYQFVYSRRHYHPQYCWDGALTCTTGAIEQIFQLDYPYTWWGFVHSARETELPEPRWRSTTRRGMSGVRVVAECSDDAVFELRTAQGDFTFSASDVLQKGRIVFPVGWKYSHCGIIVTRTGYLWYRNPPRRAEIVFSPDEMSADPDVVPIVSFARMQQRWLSPGTSVRLTADLPSLEHEADSSWLLHLQAMTAVTPDDPYQVARDYMPIEVSCDGKPLLKLRPFLRYHDMIVQILHDVWGEFPALTSGCHDIVITNRHEQLPLLINLASLRPRVRRHMDVRAPEWVLLGRPFTLRLHVVRACEVSAEFDTKRVRMISPQVPIRFEHGDHELVFEALLATTELKINLSDGETSAIAKIPAVYDIAPEKPEVCVGYDMTTVPHDDTGVMDWLLDYTHRTQLGNLVCFRPFPMGFVPDPKLLERWGEFCRKHQIWIQAINMDAAPLALTGGKFFQGGGDHELSWATYLPDPENKSTNMKEAAEGFVALVRGRVEQLRKTIPFVAYGDASGGHRYSLIAGADFLRAETMVAHTMHHLSQARAAANTLGNGMWGVHIAMQHPKQPYLESHLSQYALSLHQAWMMGARFLYEEDSLFVMFKEERQCWDDLLTKGKRNMTRNFFRFASTHPRLLSEAARGPQVRIAHVLGRYAAPFNGFICGCEQDPAYSVWGQFGRSERAWGHLQPEKSQQLLDVLMPGASTHPLRQRYDRRRFFFSGTPYGDFDQVPIEASANDLSNYKLLLLLGWHTMTEEDYAKLIEAVSGGATLLMGVPQLSTHTRREFLLDMNDLSLFRGGNVEELTGVRVLGRGVRYCGHWAHTGPQFQGAKCPPLSRVPSVSPDEDGACYLADVELKGARTVVIDAISGKPLMVEHLIGEGRVYLITTYAYPGHEELSDFCGAVIAYLASRAQGGYRVIDSSGEVFWTFWPGAHEDTGQLMLLNTDWTDRGNRKRVEVTTPAITFETDVVEGEPLIVTCLPMGALVPASHESHLEVRQASESQAKLRIHGTGPQQFTWWSDAPVLLKGGILQGRELTCMPDSSYWDLTIHTEKQRTVEAQRS